MAQRSLRVCVLVKEVVQRYSNLFSTFPESEPNKCPWTELFGVFSVV